jgi:hypothetical protein
MTLPLVTELAASAAVLAAEVSESELLRLLGMPRGRTLEGDLRERADAARAWYAEHGRPFVAARRAKVRSCEPHSVQLEDGTELRSALLSDRLKHHDGHGLFALAASAGCSVADEVAHRWSTDRPDEAYFLDRFAVAVTERLVFWASGQLCRASEASGETLLPHLSPGCGHWDLADQHRVMAILTGAAADDEAPVRVGPIELLASGALHPQHSVLAVLGVTRRLVTATPDDLCRACDVSPCAFRRAPFTVKASTLLESR